MLRIQFQKQRVNTTKTMKIFRSQSILNILKLTWRRCRKCTKKSNLSIRRLIVWGWKLKTKLLNLTIIN